MNDLLSSILDTHPELNAIERELVKSLVKILRWLEGTEVNREYLRFLGEARLLANTLGLIRKGVFEEEGADLAAMLQSAGDDGTGGA